MIQIMRTIHFHIIPYSLWIVNHHFDEEDEKFEHFEKTDIILYIFPFVNRFEMKYFKKCNVS